MSCRVGDKFIIEIGERYGNRMTITEDDLFRVKGFNSLVFDKNGLDKLEKYEDKDYENGVKEGLASFDCEVKKAYEKGLQDAWELARKIMLVQGDGGYAMSEIRNIFGTSNECKILRELSVQEALEILEAYEKSKQIQVGDVVYECDKEDYGYGVVTDLCDDECCVLWDEGYCNKMEIERLVKTGRHIDIEHLLEQIRGNE